MSLTPFNSIKETALESIHRDLPLPPFIHKITNVLEKCHLFLYFRTYKLTQLTHFREAVIKGGALHSGAKFLGASNYLKVALYIKCSLELFARYENLYISWCNFKEAVHVTYPIYQVVEWDLGKTKYSPTLTIWWKTTCKSMQQQICKVIYTVVLLFFEIFKTTLFLRDLYLLTQNDPTIEFYACCALADDLNNYGKELTENLVLLSEQLRSQESIGNSLLLKMGMKTTISTLIDKLVRENAFLFVKVNEQIQGTQEDFRRVREKGIVDFSIGRDRLNILPKSRFVPYCGQLEIDRHFANFNNHLFLTAN